ncbi:hypothetical protein LG943_09905 [Streptomonospora sp. S1-112]|uniref:Uncharacterized protein n=1 Tax=Streptomonospora mangrovi TaxID=2883123 RepID=A0A9X3NKE9_9ACTN|nr:hypothetical protein [Streptomonospora mangrovi]MDA0564640.1 hypothetical protein [Streptomonospora mangrovi]
MTPAAAGHAVRTAARAAAPAAAALPWPMKALGAMTAAEILAALEQVVYVCPDDVALERALRRELANALERGRAAGGAAPG